MKKKLKFDFISAVKMRYRPCSAFNFQNVEKMKKKYNLMDCSQMFFSENV